MNETSVILWRVLPLLTAVLLLGGGPGCGDDGGGAGPDTGTGTDATVMDAGIDAGEPDAEVVVPHCEGLGLTERAFVDSTEDATLYSLAQDITIPTTEGDVVLSEVWTGCDVYLFIPDRPRQTNGWPIDIWERDVEALFARLPRNAQVFFTSMYSLPGSITNALALIQEGVTAALLGLGQEDYDWWMERVHYVTVSAKALEGGLGELMDYPGWGLGIDRLQRLRYIGSFADQTRHDANMGWFAPNLSMAANEAIYYNFEAEREDQLEAEAATVIPIFTGELVPDASEVGHRTYVDIDLPNASAMAGFDTMTLDLHLGCQGGIEYGDCPAWDYIVNLYLCDEGDPTQCNTELGRWITTYHREGRWVHDISGLLPLLASGGSRRFSFYSSQPYHAYLDLRLSNQAKPARPEDVHYLFSGGAFNATYNDTYDATQVAIPADAVKVELATVITGHGMASPGNCAEFCNTTHHFTVNGTENMLDFNPWINIQTGCMDQVDQGTVPNQYGTWWYGRSGWCPGKEVPMVMTDITAQVTPGQDATIAYHGYYLGSDYPGSASIHMTSWLVVSK